jgi:hypothetical protein
MRLLRLVLVLLIPCAAFADEPDIARDAKVQSDIDKAKADVAKKYGDRPVQELSPEERRARAKDESDASNAALEKNGVDAKSYTHERGKMNREQQQEFSKKVDEIKQNDEAAAKAKKPEEPQKIVVEKGIPPGEDVRAKQDKPDGRSKKKHKHHDEQ